ncbi:hypothetical protein SEA_PRINCEPHERGUS_58 [Microbacterium phage PrincePhergus]|uniref:Uncharacterized protein n=1 Tax=Microbacterium phage PrincePhergus TaxID=2562193 RepID=A0A4D6E2T9_9CAUD|nr:hypothetical protein SEA_PRINCEPHERGUS_58 [Microbacterium phage PrincePhergus]
MADKNDETKVLPVVNRQDGVVPVARIRVSGSWRVVSSDFAELSLRLKFGERWLRLTHPDRPLLVARRFSGEGKREAPELSVIAALKRALGAGGAHVFTLDGSEARVGDGVTEWRYWAWLGGRMTVALETQADGTVQVIGLA